LRLLIYEHVSGGGFSGKPIPPSILSEGFGMLRALTVDAKNAGHSVITVLDSRIAELHPPLEVYQTLSVNSRAEAENIIKEAAETCDAAYIIAPETNGTLQTLVDKIEQSNTLSLNCTAEAIAEVSDKTRVQKHAKSIGLSTPETISFSAKDNKEDITKTINEKIGFPVILKPADDAGCGGLSIVTNKKQVKQAVNKIAKQAGNHFMAQQLIHGTPASVTLISNGTEALPITLNKQTISLKTPSQNSSYKGGTTPLDDTRENAAFTTAKKLAESIKGLKGYIGVDLILTEQEPMVIEVNPRLTTSYVGTRKVLKFNLAQAIVNSTLRHELPSNRKPSGYAYFEKVKTLNPNNESLQETYGMLELVSPPFPTPNEPSTCALICSHGLTLRQAKRDFDNAKRQLNNLLYTGGNKER
jgi:predicted ATP-grasp superfamily ATP-dependent carboligase